MKQLYTLNWKNSVAFTSRQFIIDNLWCGRKLDGPEETHTKERYSQCITQAQESKWDPGADALCVIVPTKRFDLFLFFLGIDQ